MAKYRQNRINEEMQKELMGILRRVKDPRVQDAFLSVTAVDCTADLKYAKIYYSALNGDPREIAKGLKAASGFIRRELAHSLNLRITPELSFLQDSSITYGAHIASILNNLEISEPEEEEEIEETDGGF
ncbi:MAG: 30S ribosome-binding factor RbfA [Ruminococcaceae bacterium]|nr:30S ribosome-binding factor RbfA [Oscillospiraceae bacterium]